MAIKWTSERRSEVCRLLARALAYADQGDMARAKEPMQLMLEKLLESGILDVDTMMNAVRDYN